MKPEPNQNFSKENSSQPISTEQELRSAMEQIGTALRGLRFGSVNVVVQDGVVVQIDRTEKVRLRQSSR